jgi:flagellar biosynthetic protein FliP
MNHTATLSVPTTATSGSGTSKLAFARHYGEMLLVMVLGMVVLGGAGALAFTAADSSLSDQSGGLQVAMMGVYMTGPMVAWMAYRGHTVAQNAEMAASMVIPTIIAATLAWVGTLGDHPALLVQHAVMLPAMLAVMVWRYDEYAHVHH